MDRGWAGKSAAAGMGVGLVFSEAIRAAKRRTLGATSSLGLAGCPQDAMWGAQNSSASTAFSSAVYSRAVVARKAQADKEARRAKAEKTKERQAAATERKQYKQKKQEAE